MRGQLGLLAAGLTLTCSLAVAGATAAEPVRFTPACPPISFHSAPQLKAQRLCMNLGVTTHGTEPGTYLFLTPGGAAFPQRAGIFKDNGTLVWWQPAGGLSSNDISVVQYRHHPYLAVWSGEGTFDDPFGMGTVSLYNEHYQRVGTITAGRPFARNRIDSHEFRITPQGDALFGIYDPVRAKFHGRPVEVYQYVVQKVSLVRGPHGIHTGRVLFQWDSIKHVPLSQSRQPAPTDHTVWDYFHGNAIAQDTDGNLLVSSPTTSAIYKINVKTGRTMWQVGSTGNPRLSDPWCYQHDIVALGHDRYSVFDDGRGGAVCATGTAHAARGVVFRVDASQTPVRINLIYEYAHTPELYDMCCGGVQSLANGDELIGWGKVPELSEFAPDGSLVMDLSLTAWSYRAYRFHWVGEPLTRPAVAAQRSANATDVWASWNGSTQVTAWRVLAGSREKHLAPVGSPHPIQGFETLVVLPHSYAFVAVQAIGAGGQGLSTSLPVATTAGSG